MPRDNAYKTLLQFEFHQVAKIYDLSDHGDHNDIYVAPGAYAIYQ